MRVVYFLVTELEQTLKKIPRFLQQLSYLSSHIPHEMLILITITFATLTFMKNIWLPSVSMRKTDHYHAWCDFIQKGERRRKRERMSPFIEKLGWQVWVPLIIHCELNIFLSCTKIMTWIHGNFISCYERKRDDLSAKSCFNIKDMS